MPTYDYACAACGHRFEVVHGVHAHGPETCPNCGEGPVRKAFAAPTVHFKGSGWAKVDRRSSAKPAATKESTTTGDTSSDSTGTTTDSTPAKPSTDSGSAPAAAASD